MAANAIQQDPASLVFLSRAPSMLASQASLMPATNPIQTSNVPAWLNMMMNQHPPPLSTVSQRPAKLNTSVAMPAATELAQTKGGLVVSPRPALRVLSPNYKRPRSVSSDREPSPGQGPPKKVARSKDHEWVALKEAQKVSRLGSL